MILGGTQNRAAKTLLVEAVMQIRGCMYVDVSINQQCIGGLTA